MLLPGVVPIPHRYYLYLPFCQVYWPSLTGIICTYLSARCIARPSQVLFVPTFLPGVVPVPHRYSFHAEGLCDFVRLVGVDSRQVDVLRGVRAELRVLRSATCQAYKREKASI